MHTEPPPAGAIPRALRPFSRLSDALTIIISIGVVIVLLWALWSSHAPTDLRARGR